MTNFNLQKQKGSMLFIGMVVLFLVIGLSATLLFTTHNHSKASRIYKASMVALYASKGGLNVATTLLNQTTLVKRIEGQIGFPDSIIYILDGETTWRRFSNNTMVDGNGSSDADKMLQVKDMPLLDAKRGNSHFRVLIKANGTKAFKAKSSSAYDNYGLSIVGFINRNSSSSSLPGVTGYKSIYVKESSVIDSYNSTFAPYGQNYTDASGKTLPNMNNKGDIGSNGEITVDGVLSPMVYGGVKPGPGFDIIGPSGPGDASQVEPGQDVSPRAKPLPMPSELDTAWISSPTSGALDVRPAETVTISSDTYYDSIAFQGDIVIQGNVIVHCKGNFTANAQGNLIINPGSSLKLYVHGTFTYNGGFQSQNQNPADFQVTLTRDDRVLTPNPETGVGYPNKVNGTSAIYAIIDAPWSNFQITGGSDYYGSIIGYNLLLGGNGDGPAPHQAKVHYDENLGLMSVITYSYFLHSNVRSPFDSLPDENF